MVVMGFMAVRASGQRTSNSNRQQQMMKTKRGRIGGGGEERRDKYKDKEVGIGAIRSSKEEELVGGGRKPQKFESKVLQVCTIFQYIRKLRLKILILLRLTKVLLLLFLFILILILIIYIYICVYNY